MDAEEERIVAVFKSLSSKSSVFIDIGDNKGQHSDRMLELCPQGRVFGSRRIQFTLKN